MSRFSGLWVGLVRSVVGGELQHGLHGLTDTKIKHDFLRASRDGKGADLTVETLDLLTLTTTGVGQTTKDLGGLTGAMLEGLSAVGLEKGDGTTETLALTVSGHAAQLVGDDLSPSVKGLDLSGHGGDLETDDGVLDQTLAKGLALHGVLDGLLEEDTGEAVGLDATGPAFVVKVVHDALEALVLDADEVLDGHLDVLEGDVGGSRGPDTRALHLARGDAGHGALEKEERDTTHAGTASADGDGEKVSKDTVGDPLLLAVDDVELAALGLLGLGLEVGDVTAGRGLGDGETDDLLSSETGLADLVAQVLGSKVEDGRQTDAETA
mmetsp:Transcript_44986/g.74985  ORF Transcript_44986/g.74985 Transcript_44986/m.74985 type:complete len:324 (+) Transcript_44986:3-974(+)